MFSNIDFYSAYQYDYYVYKISLLQSILKKPESFKNDFLDGNLDGFILEDFIRVLKSEIRQSYFHNIETLFELIFALIPEEGVAKDLDLFINLSTSNWRNNFKRIQKINSQIDGLSFLDDTIKIDEIDNPISIARYIFYYGMLPDKKIPKEYINLIDSSLSAIKTGLKIIASDFCEREEYNGYKHSLRVIPATKGFQLIDKLSEKVLLDLDLKESMSYITKNSELNEIILHTKLFDTDRDSQMVLFCSNLISNIIQLRKGGLSKTQQEGQFPIHFFGEDQVIKMSKKNIKADLILSFKIKSSNY